MSPIPIVDSVFCTCSLELQPIIRLNRDDNRRARSRNGSWGLLKNTKAANPQSNARLKKSSLRPAVKRTLDALYANRVTPDQLNRHRVPVIDGRPRPL
jgi:hypothetical protein